jgi:hypothetical protein
VKILKYYDTSKNKGKNFLLLGGFLRFLDIFLFLFLVIFKKI